MTSELEGLVGIIGSLLNSSISEAPDQDGFVFGGCSHLFNRWIKVQGGNGVIQAPQSVQNLRISFLVCHFNFSLLSHHFSPCFEAKICRFEISRAKNKSLKMGTLK